MERERVTPKSYPTNLIDKDWSKRELFFRNNSKAYLDSVHDLQLRDDDVWVVTLLKCGTTWMQELCWLLMNDCNFEAALAKDLELRSPFVEYHFLTYGDDGKALASVRDLASPRLIKSHLPLALLPAQLWQKYQQGEAQLCSSWQGEWLQRRIAPRADSEGERLHAAVFTGEGEYSGGAAAAAKN
ncbi:sulfotransferase 1E1 [Drosophila madeirensis]|uniref:Sulfotransferase 1E1 n=1 Tax=Drosophila madeirensis TaxID=30013 RepID=A0AAU9GDQ9_DROMD